MGVVRSRRTRTRSIAVLTGATLAVGLLGAGPAVADEIPPSPSTRAPEVPTVISTDPGPTRSPDGDNMCGTIRNPDPVSGGVKLSAYFADPDAEDQVLLANFRLRDLTDPAQPVTDFGWKSVPNKRTSQVTAGLLTAEHVYELTVQASDGTNVSGVGTGCRFKIDDRAPTAPVVTSPDFPPLGSGQTSLKYGSQPGRFEFAATDNTQPGGITFVHRINGGAWTTAYGSTADVRGRGGVNTLEVKAGDEAGNWSPVTTYQYELQAAGPGGQRPWTSCESFDGHSVCGPILDRYRELRSMFWDFPAPASGVRTAPDGAGKYIELPDGAAIYWSAQTGAHDIHKTLRAYWESQGGAGGALGYPAQPSYRWAGFTKFEKGGVFWDPADPSVTTRNLNGPIYQAFRGKVPSPTPADAPIGDITALPGGKGQFVDFRTYSIYWTPGGGAVVMSSDAVAAWKANGGIDGVLGFPVAIAHEQADTVDFRNGLLVRGVGGGYVPVVDQIGIEYRQSMSSYGRPLGKQEVRAGYGLVQRFETGILTYTAEMGVLGLTGSEWTAWKAAGGEAVVGLPIGPMNVNYGQRFQNGVLFDAYPADIVLSGPIYQAWRSPAGWGLGTPLAPPRSTPDQVGRFVHFASGSIYWTPKTGAQVVLGDIKTRWAGTGWELGYLGYPVTSSAWTPHGAWGAREYSHFQGGSVYMGPNGAQEIRGAIRDKWAQLGWERTFGFPLTSELTTPDGRGRFNHFQGGSIYWTPWTGAHEVHGAIRDKWAQLGWERGVLGYPLTDELVTPDGRGRFVHFERGSIYWSPQTGAREVYGKIRDTWAAQGWELGRLGYPTSGEYTPAPGQRRNNFQHGYIVWDARTGATRIVRY
ncbi:hypothetical protein OG216_22080 [Streptomycetaceae bacterium NBC_01309]